MRVVAGRAKGHRLVAPPGDRTRPTADRVREALFNSLSGLLDLHAMTVADLFAGTGALGIEALSRGAAHATFVESDAAARRAIAVNLAVTGLGAQATVRGGDALDQVRSLDPVDLAFCDPPYRFERWGELLGHLQAGVVVLESEREPALGPTWRLVRTKRYGSTLITFATQE